MCGAGGLACVCVCVRLDEGRYSRRKTKCMNSQRGASSTQEASAAQSAHDDVRGLLGKRGLDTHTKDPCCAREGMTTFEASSTQEASAHKQGVDTAFCDFYPS